jgi:hypothetical protein
MGPPLAMGEKKLRAVQFSYCVQFCMISIDYPGQIPERMIPLLLDMELQGSKDASQIVP